MRFVLFTFMYFLSQAVVSPVFLASESSGACLKSVQDIGVVFGTNAHSIHVKLSFPDFTAPRQWILNLGQENIGANHWIWNGESIQFGRWGGHQIQAVDIRSCTSLTTTFDGVSTLKLYCNHELVGQIDNTNINLQNSMLAIAGNSQIESLQGDFKGCVHEVQIHVGELTPADVSSLIPIKNECDMNQLDACTSFPCIDLREGSDHHHMMSLTATGRAIVRYYNRDWRATPDRSWDCTCQDCYAQSLVGTWDCGTFYQGSTITISSDYADNFTPERLNDHIDVCITPYRKAFTGACTGASWISTDHSRTSLSGCYAHAKANGFRSFVFGQDNAGYYHCALYSGICSGGDHRGYFKTYQMTHDCDADFDLQSVEGRKQYAAYCVPSTYRAIPCPVLRALTGSGFFQWGSAHGAVNPTSILDTIRDVLGFTGSLLDNFSFVNDIASNNRGVVDLLKLTSHIDHAASSGIIGAATGGDLWDHPEFNLGQFEKMISCSTNGVSFTAQDWGSCVNLFAQERWQENVSGSHAQSDVDWLTANPFSWAVLTAEYGNVFEIFKENDNKLSITSATTIWRDAKMPEGWQSPKRTTDSQNLDTTIRSMGIDIPQDVRDAMDNADLSIFQFVYDLAVSICGASWVYCRQSMLGRRLLGRIAH